MVKGRDSEGSSIMFNHGYSIQTPPPPPFLFSVNFSIEPFLKLEPQSNACLSDILKIYIDFVGGVKGEKFVKVRIRAREPSSTKRLRDFLSDIEYDETFDIPYELERGKRKTFTRGNRMIFQHSIRVDDHELSRIPLKLSLD